MSTHTPLRYPTSHGFLFMSCLLPLPSTTDNWESQQCFQPSTLSCIWLAPGSLTYHFLSILRPGGNRPLQVPCRTLRHLDRWFLVLWELLLKSVHCCSRTRLRSSVEKRGTAQFRFLTYRAFYFNLLIENTAGGWRDGSVVNRSWV